MSTTMHPSSDRAGVTLLEVLVAGGILVIGLASVAAILPAAGSLLGEAGTVDRAATLTSNAFADLVFQNKLAASDFTGGVTAVVMGDIFSAPAITTFYNTSPRKRLTSIAKSAIDTEAYGSAWYIMTASPIAAAGPYTAGMPVRVTIAVTRRALAATDADTYGARLLQVSPGVYQVLPPTGTTPPSTTSTKIQAQGNRKAYLTPCSWVLVNPATGPTWLQIGSSWDTYDPGTPGADGAIGNVKGSFVSFTDAAAADAVKDGSNVINARAFTGIVRVEQRILSLN